MKWFKMHTDTVLDNPTLGLLPLETQAVFFKVYALAARYDGEVIGLGLPELAWVLRMAPEALEPHLEALAQAGLVAWGDDGLQVLLYAEEQARVERTQAAERQQRRRGRSQPRREDGADVTDASRTRHGDVTDASRTRHGDVTLKKKKREEKKRLRLEAEAEAEKSGPAAAAAAEGGGEGVLAGDGPDPPWDPPGWEQVRAAYESDFGPLTPLLAQQMLPAVQEHGAQWVLAAMREAVAAGKRSWAYTRAILERWRADGYGTPPPWQNGGGKGGKGKTQQPDEATRALEDAIVQELLGDDGDAAGGAS